MVNEGENNKQPEVAEVAVVAAESGDGDAIEWSNNNKKRNNQPEVAVVAVASSDGNASIRSMKKIQSTGGGGRGSGWRCQPKK